MYKINIGTTTQSSGGSNPLIEMCLVVSFKPIRHFFLYKEIKNDGTIKSVKAFEFFFIIICKSSIWVPYILSNCVYLIFLTYYAIVCYNIASKEEVYSFHCGRLISTCKMFFFSVHLDVNQDDLIRWILSKLIYSQLDKNFIYLF